MRSFLLVFLFAFAACSGNRTAVQSSNIAARSKPYAFAATHATGADFSYAQLSGSGNFEWKTLSLRFEPQTYYEGNRLVFLIDVEVENHGTKKFTWSDYTLFIALPDEAGNWNYRLLFAQNRPDAIPSNKTVRVRYYTQLPGVAVPEQYTIVFQNFFGGNDTGFPFVRQQTAAVE